MTGKEVMKEFILDNADKEFTNVFVQNNIEEFAQRFGVKHTYESWAVYFRTVKRELDLEEVPERKYKTWRIRQFQLTGE